jgi:hypothetical protein
MDMQDHHIFFFCLFYPSYLIDLKAFPSVFLACCTIILFIWVFVSSSSTVGGLLLYLLSGFLALFPVEILYLGFDFKIIRNRGPLSVCDTVIRIKELREKITYHK